MKNLIKLNSIFILLLLAGTMFSCKEKSNPPDPQFVAAVSSGLLGRNDPVVIEFIYEQDTEKPLPSNAVTLKPSVKGSLSWQNEYTLVFTPQDPFKPGLQYQVSVNVGNIPAFNFEFLARVPVFTVQLNPVQITDTDQIIVSGFITVDEEYDTAKLEETISSKELGKPSWSYENGFYSFVFNPVNRGEFSRTAEVTWNASSVGLKEKGFTTVAIPGMDTFEMLALRLNNGIIEVSFSSPVKTNQDLRGFISLSGNTDVRYTVSSNVIKIFGDDSGGLPAGTQVLIQDLEDINGNRLNTPVQYTVPDRWELPEIRFAGSGVILPSNPARAEGARLVIETRNLSGVLVEAFHIYGNNMMQFLQVNTISGTSQLDRVGEAVWSKAYDFEWEAADQNRWVRRGLDMSELSWRFPGGMFHIRVSFRPRHVEYVCSQGHGDFSNLMFPDDRFPAIGPSAETTFWNSYYSSPGYNWNEWNRYRDDPCHPAFYIQYGTRNVTQTRNVLVSNLGLFAKRGLDGTWLIATTDLITGHGSGNTEFTVYNYQGRVLYQGRTGQDGTAFVSADRAGSMGDGSRLVLYAQNNLGKAYLRVNDSNSLSVSHFDIAGGSPSTGLRGLIYGERDVWRPGDEVFLTFLLADPQGTLPKDHPVSFELEDPRGQSVINRTHTASVDGFYPINFTTSSSAPTGNWTARVKVGGQTFSRTVKIETIMPNRLKMDLDFGSGTSGDTGRSIVIKSGQRQVSLTASWLYGAPAPGLKADISVLFSDKETTFPSYNEYTFRDPSRSVSVQRQSVWEGNLDKDGKTNFQMRLNPGTSVPGKVTARFMTRVFEPSGVFSSEQISVEYSPYSRYVGLKLPAGDATRGMLFTGRDHKAEIVVLDEDGKPVSQDVNLDCAIYQVSWRWWWERSGNEAAEFASILSRNPVSRGTVTARNGKAEWSFRINEPDWGRYLVIARDRDGGHAAAQIVYIDWPNWSSRAQTAGQGSSSTLVLTPSKASYNAGERVQVTFPSNREAAAHVVLEKGGQIIKSEWIRCDNETTKYEFTAEPSMIPNLFMHVTLLQPHMQTQNDLPIRLYGIVPVNIEDPAVILEPRIRVAGNWQAESRVSFSVREAAGRPIVYTVAVVDEGLLGLTRFNIPNPRSTFYAKEASFLKSWDLFQDVIGAYSGRLDTLLAIGGGDDITLDPDKETQRFKPVVRFFGPFEIGRNEEKTESFDLPPYIGSVRIMVLAASSSSENRARGTQRAYGTAEASVTVTSDLMVFATLPRTLSPQDEVDIPVFVNTLKDGNRSVRVTLSVPGAEIIGQASQDVAFTGSEEKLIRFKVKTPFNPGALKFTVRAESSGLRTARHVVDLQVRSTAIPVTKTVYRLIQPQETWRGYIDYPGREGANTLTASFSRLPPINLEARLQWLIQYPHGCLEQTTSGVFPQLYLDKILPMDDSRLAELRTNINSGISRVTSMQLWTGGFSYWPGESATNDWASSYAGHFLLEARKAGYSVSETVIRNWIQYQKNAASFWQSGSGAFIEQAYRLYTLALAGEADIGSMNRLRSQTNLPLQAVWRLAAAYYLAGQRDTARTMTQRLSVPQTNYRELSRTFGSTFRDKAMILEALVLMNAGHERIFPLYEEMSKELSSDNWLSTQETAYALIAMVPYMSINASSGNITMDYNAAGKSGTVSFASAAQELEFGSVTGARSEYIITNKSSVPVYAIITARGIPEEGKEPALQEGLALSVQYRSTDGKVINPSTLKLGDDMEIVVRVRNTFTQVVEEVALIVPLPASWEIINTRLTEASPVPGTGRNTTPTAAYRYQDIRDDRVMTYFNLNRGEEKTVRFLVTKTYEGNFFRPAIHAYAMYDESIRALIPGAR